MGRKELGQKGEKIVGAYLVQKGYFVVQYNYRSGHNEIDLIARNSSYLVFVEVKTRKKGALVSGAEAVTQTKQRHLLHCAQAFLMSEAGKKWSELQPRFDVAQVTVGDEASSRAEITYFKNAFGE